MNYVFDNAAPQTAARFSALARIFDPGTVRHLTALGVAEGWNCLEVGGGGGSIAAWLCDRVGPGGRVVATDLDTRFLEQMERRNLEVRRHNLVTDSLPRGPFDLVHVRLVLLHLPERESVLARLIGTLRPGGLLLAEEFDSLSSRSDAAINPAEVPLPAFRALLDVLVEQGVDLRYGRLLAGRLRAHGLHDVMAEGRIFMWPGRSIGTELMRANLEQLREAMIESGKIGAAELERDLARLEDDDFLVPSPVMWAAWGGRRRER
ncbi:MAG TPA: methyltransferase [Burkholderiales bacterium]|nr:methyltransferase [Burkholderiales bacterium]